MAYSKTVGTADVVIDNLLSFDPTAALSANQGRLLEMQLNSMGDGRTHGQTALLGQTVFTLPTLPTDANSVVMNVNGAAYVLAIDFSISGAIVTWMGAFKLAPSDAIFFTYK